jgi:arylsulfatase A-like enzyme
MPPMTPRIAALATLLAPLVALHAADSAGPDLKLKPNIVVILADDLGYSDFGCYGGEIDTPNIDRLAQGGLRFSSYYSEAKCNPSRQSLLTGKYAIRAYNGRDATIAECLAAGGYSRYMAGKWDMVADIGGDQRKIPQARGFEHFFGTPMGCGSYFAPIKLTRDGQPAEQESMAPGFYYTDAITDNAVSYINDAPREKPLFLYAAYTAPHWPLHAREADIAKNKGRFKAGWDQLREARLARMRMSGLIGADVPLSAREKTVPAWEAEKHPEWKQRLMEVYAAQIECLDRGVGRILQALDRTGRRDNTLIIVTSDNGACAEEYSPDRPGNYLNEQTRDGRPLRVGNLPTIMPGPEDTWQSYGRGWAALSNTPLRRFKGEEYEGGNRVPLIACWPGMISKPGSIVQDVAHVIDLLPTVLEAAGLEYPKTFQGREVLPPDGKSLLPFFRGGAPQTHDFLFWEFGGKRAVRQGDWKLVYPRGGPWELYHIPADPVEGDNLAARLPERVEQMSARWTEWFSLLPPSRRRDAEAGDSELKTATQRRKQAKQ